MLCSVSLFHRRAPFDQGRGWGDLHGCPTKHPHRSSVLTWRDEGAKKGFQATDSLLSCWS